MPRKGQCLFVTAFLLGASGSNLKVGVHRQSGVLVEARFFVNGSGAGAGAGTGGHSQCRPVIVHAEKNL